MDDDQRRKRTGTGLYRGAYLINLGYGDASGNYPRGPRLPFDSVVQML